MLRPLIRDGLVAVAIVLTAPLWLPAAIVTYRLGRDTLFTMGSELLSLVPGLPGIFLRRGYYAMTLNAFAWDCQVGFGTTFSHSRVRIARHVVIGNRCSLGCVNIEEGVALGSNIDILSGRYQHGNGSEAGPVQYVGGEYRQLRIGRNAWVGNSSVVMGNIGEGCIVGAGSVVVNDLPANCTAVGNPAVIKKYRRQAA